MTLSEKLKTFDIPTQRRDITKFENVFWLTRNLPIRNLDNPALCEVMVEINKLGKKMTKDILKTE